MVSSPFVDPVAAGQLIVQKGGFYFLKVKVERNSVLTPAHANTWTRTDICVIRDPDGNVVTSSFATKTIEPGDVDDTYDENHATYKGDLATPENVGLFSDDLGHLALKILVPSNAEETYLNATRYYTVTWTVLVSDGAGGTIQVGPTSEAFNVAPAGTLIFEDESVEAADVTRGISTVMDADQVGDLITEARDWFFGEVEGRGSTVEELGYNGKRAIIMMARASIFTFDDTAGLRPNFVREGPDQVRYGDREKITKSYEEKANAALKLWLREHAGLGKPYAGRVDRAREADVYDLSGLVLRVVG